MGNHTNLYNYLHKTIYVAVGISLLLTICACEELAKQLNESSTNPNAMTFKPITVNYPETFKDTTVIDDYFGKKVSDPYRWLEDDDAPETTDWVKRENATTSEYLSQIPFRTAIRKRLEALWNYERFSPPSKKGGKYYFSKNDGLQNQSVLYVQNDLNVPASVVLDPNQFSDDGTASLGGMSFSKNGRYLAYEISEGGSDWRTIKVLDLTTKETLSDEIKWVKFSQIAWFKEGFFYSRYPTPEAGAELSGRSEFQQVHYHKLGTDQSEDELVFTDRANPYRGFFASTTEDERFLILNMWESTSGNALYFKDLTVEGSDFVPVIEDFTNDFTVIDNVEDNLLVLTNHKAPNGKLISVHTSKPEMDYWQTIISENENVLQQVQLLGGKIMASYIANASSKVEAFSLEGAPLGELALPGIGTVGGLRGSRDSDEAFYEFTSFTQPATIYRLELEALQSTLFKAPNTAFDPSLYTTKQVWYKSHDGTKIPMFVIHKKELKFDGQRPTLLYGYGGFNISILPQYNITRLNLGLSFLENNGILAIANIRGGGEFGKKWHQAGTKSQKQNVFNDFHAAAEYLINENYTSSEKLTIYGRSNGGLLVGACMTQRPDLYAVALPAVGVLDMLRYQEFTIGRAWSSDYGLSENDKEFDHLIQYSPLHNAVPAKYPATMITTADHDDRVVPAHSFKFAAALQENQRGDEPVLIRVETSAGHGAGKPVSKSIDEAADILAFSFYNLKVVPEEKVKD